MALDPWSLTEGEQENVERFYSKLPSDIADKAREDAEHIRKLDHDIGRDFCEIGDALRRQQLVIPHGKWGQWLRLEFGYSAEHARRFININENIGPDQIARYQNLGFSVIARLAQPGVTDEFREKMLALSASGTRLTLRRVDVLAKQDAQRRKSPAYKARVQGRLKGGSPSQVLPLKFNTDKVPEYEVRNQVRRLADKWGDTCFDARRRFVLDHRDEIVGYLDRSEENNEPLMMTSTFTKPNELEPYLTGTDAREDRSPDDLDQDRSRETVE